jgi:hypothetical protein
METKSTGLAPKPNFMHIKAHHNNLLQKQIANKLKQKEMKTTEHPTKVTSFTHTGRKKIPLHMTKHEKDHSHREYDD